MSCLIVDYGSGNLRSAEKAFQRMARETGVGGPVTVSPDPADVARAERVVLPGVGAFGDCRDGLRAAGLWDAVAERAAAGAPFFGVCVGMQLMATRGLEHGVHDGYGWIPGEVAPLRPADPALKIPHMGWNALSPRPHPVLDGVAEGDHVYFVHSFHLVAERPEHVFAVTDHGGPVTAAVGRDNLFGVQFHPEKSQRTGLRVIANFLGWRP